MCEVTASNFEKLFPKIETALKNATIVAIDSEFSGITKDSESKLSLFDTVDERYAKVKANIEPYIVIQFGLTTYQFLREKNKYNAESFNFYLFPRTTSERDAQFLWQGSAIEFLASYGFDFNKFAYQGISYLNEADEAVFRQKLRGNSLMRNVERLISFKDEDELAAVYNKVAEWLASGVDPEEPLIIKTNSPMLQYLTHKELRNRFLNVWTFSGDGEVIVKRVIEEVRAIFKEEDGNSIEDALLNSYVGFSRVFKLLVSLKKPIVGHNLFLDLMFMHKQFYKPLPKRYTDFKNSIHHLFPTVFDTKFISFEMRKILKKEQMWKSNGLNDLYKYFKDGRGRHVVLNSPLIELKEKIETGEDKLHEAGWDAYCTGYCFIRQAHIIAVKQLGGREMTPLTSSELLAGVRRFANSINLIRASVSHLTLDGPEPECTRPQWLHIQAVGRQSINISQIADMLSTYGTVDVKPYSTRQALVAVGNHGSARDILTHFQSNRDFRVAPYNLLKHSSAVRLLLWSGVLVSGGVFAWMLHRCPKA